MLKKVFILLLFIGSFSPIYTQAYLSELKTNDDFETLSGLPLSNKYGQLSAIKVVVDLKTDKIYYLNASDYKFHHEFCEQVLRNNVTLSYFNEVNYENSSQRQYLLGNLNLIETSGKYFLELSPTDLMSEKLIYQFFNKVQNSFYNSKKLLFLINSNRLNEISDSLALQIPILHASEIYQDLDYQAIGKGESDGYLKIIDDLETCVNQLQPTDIIVINQTPLFLPQVAGVIVTKFQTPLSHLSILGQNRDIPIMAYTNAFRDHHLQRLNNSPVHLKVESDTFYLRQIEEVIPKTSASKKIKLKYDLDVDSLISIKDLKRKSSKYVGNKAQNFRELYKLSLKNNFKVPESAFAIPFFYYHQHLIENKIDTRIEHFLTHYKSLEPDSIQFYLKQIRREIKNTPVNDQLLKDTENMILALGTYKRMRFRSSTNAEDAKGFSGAGLYSSKTGILYDDQKTIDRAIKKVWASLWNYEAFMEREFFSVDHRQAYMGILVHRSFPSEVVNGVAITKNLYRYGYLGFTVNAQLGNENVVQPSPGVICDQFICYPNTLHNMYDEHHTIEIITTSSLNNGELVMTPEEIYNLAYQLHVIKKHFFYTPYSGGEYALFAMDVEFKIDGENRTLYIKQARPFND
ncbi:hypothetical protein KFE94_05695 [bacterium SCSIO 12643]|nr:hypothetical protein KFE94_05695 [bacterium SCSIO 12643]